MLLLFPMLLACRSSCDVPQSSSIATTTLQEPFDLWSGRTQLRGANVWQRRVYPELDGPEFMGPDPIGPPMTQADFNELAGLGANYVNLSHPGLYTENPPYELDLEAQESLDRLLEMARAADLFAVITFRTGPGRSEFWAYMTEDTTINPEEGWFDPSYYNHDVWTEPSAQQAWAEMWRYTAERYRDHDHVVGYDLMCEPNPEEIFFDIWRGPADFYPAHEGSSYDWNLLYPTLVDAIRTVDTTTPILVQPMGYGTVRWLPALKPHPDSRVVYTVHQYEPMVYTHQQPPRRYRYPGTFDADLDEVPERFDRQWLDDLLFDVDAYTQEHDVPVACNEFGIIRWEPKADAFMNDMFDLLDERGINHALWDWASSWGPFAVNDAFDFRHGPRPNHHTDQNNDLMCVIQQHWQRNTLRPSNIQFDAP